MRYIAIPEEEKRMLCKNCGKELPIAGQFCPFCGAPVEQQGVNDETAVFTLSLIHI